MIHIAIFASGSGSNAEQIHNYFKDNDLVKVSLIVCNNSKAFVIKRAEQLGLESIVIDKNSFYKSDLLINQLAQKKIDWIVLAGFLWLIPENLIAAYPDKIINIHPSLLPSYGGKGMYGKNVHKAVKENNERQTGMTIHLVNAEYDKGRIIFQAACDIEEQDNVDDIAQKVNKLEHQYYSKVIDALVTDKT